MKSLWDVEQEIEVWKRKVSDSFVARNCEAAWLLTTAGYQNMRYKGWVRYFQTKKGRYRFHAYIKETKNSDWETIELHTDKLGRFHKTSRYKLDEEILRLKTFLPKKPKPPKVKKVRNILTQEEYKEAMKKLKELNRRPNPRPKPTFFQRLRSLFTQNK